MGRLECPEVPPARRPSALRLELPAAPVAMSSAELGAHFPDFDPGAALAGVEWLFAN